MSCNSIFFCLVLFFLPKLSFSSDILGEEDMSLEPVPSLESLIDLDEEWGLNLEAVYKRQSLLRSRDEITKGDIAADIMNLLALKDCYVQRKEVEDSVKTLQPLVDKMTVKISEYKKDLKKNSKSIVDLQTSMKVLQEIRVEKLIVLEGEKRKLLIGMGSIHLLEVITRTQQTVFASLVDYGITLQHLEALPCKSEVGKISNVRL